MEATQPNQAQESLDCYAKLELFGHSVIYGKVTSVSLAGAAFIRCDVLNAEGGEENTQYYSPGAVYAIKPISKELAIGLAGHGNARPISSYDLEDAMKTVSTGRLEEYLTRRKALELTAGAPEPSQSSTDDDAREAHETDVCRHETDVCRDDCVYCEDERTDLEE